LFSLSVDADIILDLHCDNQAVMHLYTGTPNWPAAEDLAAELDSHATLLATQSGGNPFDEAAASVYWRLAETFADKNIPCACLGATIELRGEADVDETMATADARALIRFLQRRSLISGSPQEPAVARYPATPLAAVELVRNPHAGIISFEKKPGDEVKKGDLVAILIDPLVVDHQQARTEIRANTSGLLFARIAKRFMPAGQVIAKIAGAEVLPNRVPGQLMTD
jgi:hypothetical protein